jgi:hypothetical protein
VPVHIRDVDEVGTGGYANAEEEELVEDGLDSCGERWEKRGGLGVWMEGVEEEEDYCRKPRR